MSHDPYDPPSPLAIVRGLFAAALGIVSLYVVARFAVWGEVDGKMVALALVLWGMYAGVAQVYHLILAPFGSALARLLEGSFASPTGAPPEEEETAVLNELLDRLLAKYPDDPALAAVRRLRGSAG